DRSGRRNRHCALAMEERVSPRQRVRIRISGRGGRREGPEYVRNTAVHGLAVVGAATPVVYLLFFATYTQWEGGYSYGPRYLVPALALLGLGIGPALEGAS